MSSRYIITHEEREIQTPPKVRFLKSVFINTINQLDYNEGGSQKPDNLSMLFLVDIFFLYFVFPLSSLFFSIYK